MKDDQHHFLTLLRQPPARLTAQQVAWVLNCQEHDVPVLVAARLLKPLGEAPPNSVKYFAAQEVREQAQDRAWLVRVTNALNQHWRRKNAAKKTATPSRGARPGPISTPPQAGLAVAADHMCVPTP